MSTNSRGRWAIAAAATLLSAALVAGGTSAPAAAPKKKTPTAASALSALVRQTTALPRTGISPAKRSTLLRRARKARGAARARPCVAVRDLASYRRTLKSTKVRSTLRAKARDTLRKRLAAVGTSSMTASRRLLADRRTKACGGGVAASTLADTRTRVLRSDENGMSIRVQLPQLRFVPETGGGKTWTKLVLPNTDAPGAPGTPGIPVASSLIAVPDGATLDVKATKTTSYSLDGVEVYPVQPDSVDQSPGLTPKPNFGAAPFAAAPFTVNQGAYAQDGNVPAAPAFGKKLGQARDMNIAGVQVPATQYNPKTDKLRS